MARQVLRHRSGLGAAGGCSRCSPLVALVALALAALAGAPRAAAAPSAPGLRLRRGTHGTSVHPEQAQAKAMTRGRRGRGLGQGNQVLCEEDPWSFKCQQKAQQVGQGPRLPAAAAAANCTEDLLGATECPDVAALLAFRAANIDPFGLLSSWEIPCALTGGSSAKVQAAAGAAPPGGARLTPAQCLQLNKYVCSGKWAGVTCGDTWRVTGLMVSPMQSSAPNETLWGNFSESNSQSLPPQIGDLSELTSLDLSYNYAPSSFLGGLIGTLPQELSRLTKLVSLNLAYNRFWGPVPEFLSALQNLQILSLSVNNFTGAAPESLSRLAQLAQLKLVNMGGISGPIPSAWGRLASLQNLALGGAGFTGGVPDSFAGLVTLQYLDLSKIGLTGDFPRWLPALTRLQFLDLTKNNLTGSLPEGLSRLTGLNVLALGYNQLSGSVPASLLPALCSAVKEIPFYSFNLERNRLTGPLPSNYSACGMLSEYYVRNNQFSGAFPPASAFRGLSSIVNWDVGGNRLQGTVPRNLMALMPTASLLNLQDNQLTGPMPRVLCNSQVLQANFSRNQFTGQLASIVNASVLAGCSAVGPDGPGPANMTLDLSHNQLQGPLPAYLFTLAAMSELHLGNNRLTGALPLLRPGVNCTRVLAKFTAGGNGLTGGIPTSFGTCRQLQQLSLGGNQLTGTVPAELSRIGVTLQILELQENQLSGPVPGTLNFFQQLRTLNLSRNALTGPLSSNFTQLPLLTQADLSSNRIQGPIPVEINQLSVLKRLDLSDNELSGSIPISLAPPNLPLLTFLDLSHNVLEGAIPWGFENSTSANLTLDLSSNQLTGEVPGGADSVFAATMPAEVTADNAGLCGGAGLPACPEGNAPLSTGAIVGIAVGGAAAVALIILLAWWCLRVRSEWAGGTMLVFEKLDFQLTVDDILEATENFSDKYKLGRGGFGTVYRATLQDGRTVAIKRLALASTQGDREFQAEMQTLGNIRHRNLVILVAAYIAPAPSAERLLIYNFLSGGSLDNILNNDKDMPKDSPYRQWEVRRRIALDVARGMKYLHHDCTPRIIHRDMKPANVLMDDQLVAHVADFGLARELDATKSHMSTAVFGTIGYLAPEYTQRGRLTFKSDVFAYGVLLLQLITGKQPTDEDVAERGLARWVGASATASVMDDRMEVGGEYTNQILGAIKLGLLCTSRVPADRPSMAEVVHLLENLDDFAKGINAEDAV